MRWSVALLAWGISVAGVATLGCNDGTTDRCASDSWKNTDGDPMSDMTEKNPANNYLNLDYLRYDSDPTIASGTPSSGTLIDGLNLKDQSGPCGYVHYRGGDAPDTDDWGTATLLGVIEYAASQWKGQHPSFRMQTGDMSKQNGGSFPPHTAHQNGTDVDLRYVRGDHLEIGVSVDPNDASYAALDVQATEDLIQLFQNDSHVQVIFVNTEVQLASETKISRQDDHTDHFHVRIWDPDGSN